LLGSLFFFSINLFFGWGNTADTEDDSGTLKGFEILFREKNASWALQAQCHYTDKTHSLYVDAAISLTGELRVLKLLEQYL
jgi:hypothetical protein